MIPLFVQNKKGETYLNDLSRYVKSGILTCDPAFVPLVIAASSNGPPIVIEGNADALSEIFSFSGFHDAAVLADVQARMTVQITDISWRRRLMNRAIIANHVFGTNLQPGFIDESIFLRGQQTLVFDFTNGSAAGATNFRFAMEIRKFQQTVLTRPQIAQHIALADRDKLFKTPYWFTSVDPIVIPAGAILDAFFIASEDIYLLLQSVIASFISAGVAGDTVEGFSVEFFDAKTERPLQNQPIARSCCSGTAGFPFVLPVPWLVEPTTVMRVRFRNLITDAPTTVFWTFRGVACYHASSPFDTTKVVLPIASQAHVGVP